jgi:hypothetical protein
MKILLSLCVWLCVATISAAAEEPHKTNLCEIKKDPEAFNRKLVQITVFVSHGFEDFSAWDPECEYTPSVWVEYGGTKNSDTMYCCGVTPRSSRPKVLKVEGIPVPLIEDEMFRQFDTLIRSKRGIIHATIVGRFFAGQREGKGNWGGYGHMGCCSLLVVQQVIAADKETRKDLDYRSSRDESDTSCASYTRLVVTRFGAILQAQEEAETDNSGWRFDEPERVAKEFLAKLSKLDPSTITQLNAEGTTQGRRIYTWKPKGTKGYVLVLSKPYWLSFYARDPKKVAWVPAAYRTCS